MITDLAASRHLGKKSSVAEQYDKTLLVAVLREENRKNYGISSESLPFSGFDVWHAYEFSTLTENGLPVTKVLKLKYSCESKYIVESKSLKLYLNSFNMTNFGKTQKDALEKAEKTIKKDLSELLQTDVCVNFLDDDFRIKNIFENYSDITEFADIEKIRTEDFKENPKLLEPENSELKEYRLKYTSLRSNCRVTHQPDFGDVFIYYKSDKHIKEDSLIKYLVSFRSEYHFHEECVEMIYKRLSDILNKGDELLVCAMYTRRGGIDINPLRYSKKCTISDYDDLSDLKKLVKGGIKQ